MPSLSIITVVFNGAKSIRNCIESVLKQGCNVEHIVVDGGSTDGTLEILDEYKQRLANIISEPDRGIYDAMNKGLTIAAGNVIGLLNSDDVYAREDILANVIKVFENEGVDSCYGDLVYVDPLDTAKVVRYWRSGNYSYRRFYWGWMPPHPTFFVRRPIYMKYGCFNLDLKSAADYELMLRFLLKYRITTHYIPKILVKMRTGGKSNVTIGNRINANLNDRQAWKVNGLNPYPWTLFLKPLRKVGQWVQKPQGEESRI